MFYKLITGYNAEDYIEIDDTELEKAYYCFLEKKDSIFSGGAVKGSMILVIQPDYHRAMGWNRGYKLGPDDYAELKAKRVDRIYTNFLSETKDKIQYLMSKGRIDLIGKNILLDQIDGEIKKLNGNTK